MKKMDLMDPWEIFCEQVRMVNDLFFKHYKISPNIILYFLHKQLEEAPTFFPRCNIPITEKNKRTKEDEEICIFGISVDTYFDTPHSLSVKISRGIMPDALIQKYMEEYLDDPQTAPVAELDAPLSILDQMFREVFGEAADRWTIDPYEKAILVNSGYLLMFALNLYDAYIVCNQTLANPHPSLPEFFAGLDVYTSDIKSNKENVFGYSIFINTISRYLASIYSGYNMETYAVFSVALINDEEDGQFTVHNSVRSMKDQQGFEDFNIPKQIFPSVLPDF